MYLTLNIIFSVPFFLHIGVSQSRATDQVSPPPPLPRLQIMHVGPIVREKHVIEGGMLIQRRTAHELGIW